VLDPDPGTDLDPGGSEIFSGNNRELGKMPFKINICNENFTIDQFSHIWFEFSIIENEIYE